MNVLFVARSTLCSSPGGDTVQLFATAKYLERLGVGVNVQLGAKSVDLSSYDVVHCFNIGRPADILPFVGKSTPLMVSSVFVDYSEYDRFGAASRFRRFSSALGGDQVEYAKALVRAVRGQERIRSVYFLLHGQAAGIRKVLSSAAMILPNSRNEYLRLVAKYGVSPPYTVIPNAIDSEFFNDQVVADDTFRDSVLCVARIEGLKNQLALIRALKNTGLRLVLVGKPSPNSFGYYEQCRAAASANVVFLGHVPHEKVAAIYKSARVHAMPSWFETTGLSSLEAAAMGCSVVISDKGDQREYFGEDAHYCDPSDTHSIRQAVVNAYSRQTNPDLVARVRNEFVWERAAERTLCAYSLVLSATTGIQEQHRRSMIGCDA